MDYTQIVTIGGTLVLIVGGIYTLRQQIRKSKEDSEMRIISAIKTELEPVKVGITKDREQVQTNLQVKEQSINDLWKDLETMEDHLNKLQVDVAKHTGVIDMQTPLIIEIRQQIDVLRNKLEVIQAGLNIK